MTSKRLPQASVRPPCLSLLQMGNNACCSDTRTHQVQSQRVEIEKNPLPEPSPKTFQLPLLPPQVQLIFSEKRPFEKELAGIQCPHQERLGEETYYGELDENGLPSGWGKLFKKNGAVYAGHFQKGKAEGLGICVFADGSYYQGEMMDNSAETTCGHFQNGFVDYRGGFHLNEFHGQGVEKGSNFEYSGEFECGKRKFGTLRWEQAQGNFVYTGGFDANGKFTGKANLQDPFGVYEGHFQEGLKEGFGTFQFKSKIKYEGYYKANLKNGRGSIVNADGTIAFCGEFLNGLPHGKGYATDKKGIKHSLEWNQGVYADLL